MTFESIPNAGVAAAIAARRAEGMKKYGKAKFSNRLRKGREFLDAEHVYCLFRGDANFGRVKTMTGREAQQENRKFEDVFFRTKKESARLFRWKLDPGEAAVTALSELRERSKRKKLRWL